MNLKDPNSLFAHEAEALETIRRYVEARKLGVTLNNLELHDPQSNRYFETDLVLLTKFGVYVVELKHWSGRIEIRPNSWLQNNSFFKPDPHKANNFKAKLLRGLYERRFPYSPSLYFQSVVVLTNPDVLATGCAIPNSDTQNPTFESIERFLQYLKNQRSVKTHQLDDAQCQAFADYVQKLSVTGAPKDFVFPGYEIVERLYHFHDRAEVVARRTDIRHRRLSRLRVFFLPAGDQSAREKATATLNAVEKIGEHPNILKVWDIPNENNYLVEGSDWSETGTLRDYLERKTNLNVEEAIAITIGLARGLQAAHAQYIVHRELSPENVLMVNGVPKLMNFDLSFQLEEDRVTVIPDATKLKRSPYIAPEIYVGGTVPEATSDLFSLGVILYEMIVGNAPFGCSTDLERSGGQLTQDQIAALRKGQNTPASIIDVVSTLIRQSSADRIAKADAVLALIEDIKLASPAVVYQTNQPLAEGAESVLYKVERLWRKGAESQIYLAVGALGRLIALKLFNHDVPLQRVLDEQKFAATVHHPSLVKVDNYNQWSDGRWYVSFEWVSEQSLRDEIARGARPNIERFVEGAEQLLDALASLHRNSDEGKTAPILHNDIKPENILLGRGGRLVLIDFGAASEPHVGTYEGTEGYVAPDLRLGKDRKYSVDGDLYSLSVSLHEWLFGVRPGGLLAEEHKASERLVDWLLMGCSPDSAARYGSAEEMKEALKAVFTELPTLPLPVLALEVPVTSIVDDWRDSGKTKLSYVVAGSGLDPNPFVPYLNSLHSRSAASENALAEFQARNQFFGHIHVPHPIAEVIRDKLLGKEKGHVVLTGHAGDGKSTIAVEILKNLSGLPADQPLRRALNRREDLTSSDRSISLVKDFSEWSDAERQALVAELLNTSGPRFLIISNTGTLLDAFTAHERSQGGDWVSVEDRLLKAMDAATPSEMEFHSASFVILNLAMMDNLEVARQVFERMLAPERWEACASASCHSRCPIYQNVSLMQQNRATVVERLFLAYRRMYEYGTRLTLRQLSAHMAYMITAGLEYADIEKMTQRAKPPLLAEFMFFNRFFGDNGKTIDSFAVQLRGVRAVREQTFGTQPCPTWERRLWLRSQGNSFQLRAPRSPDDFESLRRCGAGLSFDDDVSSTQARDQVRRAVFFLHDFGHTDGDSFLSAFLRSGMLLDFVRWQKQDDETLGLQESTSLHKRLMHVLQEHFTGVRLPEGPSSDRHLFITLSRHSQDVRQSAQVVLARYPEDDFKIRLHTRATSAGVIRRELVLDGPSGLGQLSLALSLPFLDYVMLRNQGQIGKSLQTAYVDRLERFKGQLIRQSSQRKSDDIMLVRLRTNHTFRRQIFAVRNDRLEVTDA